MNENRLLDQSEKAACVPEVCSARWPLALFSLVFCLPISALLTSLSLSLLLHFFCSKLFPNARALALSGFLLSASAPALSPSQRGTNPPAAHRLCDSLELWPLGQREKHFFPEVTVSCTENNNIHTIQNNNNQVLSQPAPLVTSLHSSCCATPPEQAAFTALKMFLDHLGSLFLLLLWKNLAAV